MAEPKSAPQDGRIVRRAGLVAAGTLTSRVLGAVRDMVIAASFAIGATDAFFLAFTIPNALRVLLGEGAVSGAFVPVFSEVREKHGEERARHFYKRLVGAMLVVLFVVTVVGVLAAPWLVTLYAGGFRDDPAQFELTVTLTRLVFPYIFLMGVAALITGALHAMKRFLAPAFAPTMLNIALIAAPFALVPVATALGLPAIAALAIGALIGGTLHVGVQLPSLKNVGLLVRPKLDLEDAYVRKSFRLLAPLLAGLGVYQLNVMLSRLLASFLPEGSLSYLYYGQRLVEIPQGMFALAIASAALPTLSDMAARGEVDEAKKIFRYGLRLSLFVAIPSTFALALLAEPTVAVLFGRGAFGPEEVSQTAQSLVLLAAGIWAVASVRTIVPMFHALGDTRTPVVASAANLIVFGVVALSLMGPLKHVGLAAAISAASTAQLVTLLVLLRRRIGPLGLREVAASATRATLAAIGMAAALFFLLEALTTPGGLGVGAYGAVVGAGALVYLALAFVLRAPELQALSASLRRRVSRR